MTKEVDGLTFVVEQSIDEQFGAVTVDFTSGFLGKRFMVHLTEAGDFQGTC